MRVYSSSWDVSAQNLPIEIVGPFLLFCLAGKQKKDWGREMDFLTHIGKIPLAHPPKTRSCFDKLLI